MLTRALLVGLVFAATVQAQQTYVIRDAKSLKEGLDIYLQFRAGTRAITWEETLRATEAAAYTQAFAEACYMWQMKSPEKAPFRLPSDPWMAADITKIVHKYLSEHSDRLGERAESLVFDALVSAFPRK